MARELADVDGVLVNYTPKAWLVLSDQTNRQAWVPRSVGEVDPENAKRGGKVTLTLPMHMAIEKELV